MPFRHLRNELNRCRKVVYVYILFFDDYWLFFFMMINHYWPIRLIGNRIANFYCDQVLSHIYSQKRTTDDLSEFWLADSIFNWNLMSESKINLQMKRCIYKLWFILLTSPDFLASLGVPFLWSVHLIECNLKLKVGTMYFQFGVGPLLYLCCTPVVHLMFPMLYIFCTPVVPLMCFWSASLVPLVPLLLFFEFLHSSSAFHQMKLRSSQDSL